MTIAKLRYSLLKISAQKNVLGISVAQRMLTMLVLVLFEDDFSHF